MLKKDEIFVFKVASGLPLTGVDDNTPLVPGVCVSRCVDVCEGVVID
jgi:hypothetical protein